MLNRLLITLLIMVLIAPSFARADGIPDNLVCEVKDAVQCSVNEDSERIRCDRIEVKIMLVQKLETTLYKVSFPGSTGEMIDLIYNETMSDKTEKWLTRVFMVEGEIKEEGDNKRDATIQIIHKAERIFMLRHIRAYMNKGQYDSLNDAETYIELSACHAM